MVMKKKDTEKSGQNGENNRSDNIENGENDEPNFSDPEGFVDDITDEELLGDFLKNKPTETDGVESVIVVDGIPQVGPDRFEKLKGVINKVFSRMGTVVNEYYPKTEAGVTKGYVFIEYSSPVHALEAVKLTNNHKLDKQHTFSVNLFTDFKKCEEIPETWEPPTPNKYKEQGNLHYYLLEPDAYDQFVVTIGNGQALQIWLNTAPEPTKLEERNRWTETYCKWSPLGSYLATFHRKGLALWAGPAFEQVQRFNHLNVQFIDFSPCEKYLVTYSPPSNDMNSDQKTLIIWDVRTGMEKRSFSMETGQNLWPIFRWSYNDQYFARIVGDVLSVYTTPTFGLLDKKSFKIPGIRDFSWSPSDNILAYWVAEDKDVPARVTLLEIPSRNEIRAKNLFNVADCKIHWQKSGDYLCVKVDRYSKVKKEKSDVKYSGMYYNFEIFHMREKQIPVDSVEIKEIIHAFAWEPIGNKFVIIHGDAPNINVSFYGVKTGQAPSLLKRLEKRNCNHLFWAPAGQFIVLAGLRSMSGVLEFVDTNDFISMNVTDHYACSDVEWDPTGRYVVTAVSFWKTKFPNVSPVLFPLRMPTDGKLAKRLETYIPSYTRSDCRRNMCKSVNIPAKISRDSSKVDTGYWMWSFQGKLLKRVYLDNFCQFLWRPRPPTLLSADRQKEIKKSLKKYSSQFESKDRMRMTKASKELIEKRQKLMHEFEEHRKKRLQQWAKLKTRRLELRNNIDTDELDSDTTNVEEEIVEFLIKEETFIID